MSMARVKICTKCNFTKHIKNFSLRSDGRYVSWCKDCVAERSRQHYQENKEYYAEKNKVNGAKVRKRNRDYLIEYLRTHPCVDCGEADIEVLQFDHVEPLLGKKTRPTNSNMVSLKRLQNEIDKCEVRCANCHVRRTRQQFGWSFEQTGLRN